MVKDGLDIYVDNELALEKYVVAEALQATPSHTVKCQKWNSLEELRMI